MRVDYRTVENCMFRSGAYGPGLLLRPARPNLITKGDHMSPANPGESVREQLAARSTEKALANLDREDARADRWHAPSGIYTTLRKLKGCDGPWRRS
jgi:hypothetical protein